MSYDTFFEGPGPKKITDEEFFKNFDFCCDWMRYRISLTENQADGQYVFYRRCNRTYFIEAFNDSSSSTQIEYCPFCGKKLPNDLDEEWFDTIYEELGPEYLEGPHAGTPPTKELPEEFKTDEWWKKRGL